MWKLKDYGDITIDEIKNFAEYQFCDMNEGDTDVYIDSEFLPEELKEYAVINPWVDDTGRAALNDDGAARLYTKEGIDNFIKKATDYLKAHRLIMWDQFDGEKCCWTIGLFMDTDENENVTYHIDKADGDHYPTFTHLLDAENAFYSFIKHRAKNTPASISGG